MNLKLQGTVREHDGEDGEEGGRPTKRLRTELLEIYLNQIENMASRKRKEVHLKKMKPAEQEKLRKAIQKEIQTNLASGDYMSFFPRRSRRRSEE